MAETLTDHRLKQEEYKNLFHDEYSTDNWVVSHEDGSQDKPYVLNKSSEKYYFDISCLKFKFMI